MHEPSALSAASLRYRPQNCEFDRDSRSHLRSNSIIEPIDCWPDRRIDPLVVDVFGVNREPLNKVKAGPRTALRQLLEMRPRRLGIDVVAAERRNAAPVIDTCV